MKYNITESDFVEAHRLAVGVRRWLVVGGVVCLALLFSIRLNIDEDRSINWLAVGLTGALLSVAFVAAVARGKRRLLRIYGQQKALHEELDFDFDDAAILWKSPSGTCTLKWQDVYTHKENAKIILIYESQSLMRIVPKRAFPDATLLNKCLLLLRSKGEQRAAPIPRDPRTGHSEGER